MVSKFAMAYGVPENPVQPLAFATQVAGFDSFFSGWF
jgi:hypothetical protein